jgi:hypothetical protein
MEIIKVWSLEWSKDDNCRYRLMFNYNNSTWGEDLFTPLEENKLRKPLIECKAETRIYMREYLGAFLLAFEKHISSLIGEKQAVGT